MKYDVFVLLCACVVNKQLWRAQQALNAQCYKCQVMGVLACKCVHVREPYMPNSNCTKNLKLKKGHKPENKKI